MGLSDALYSRMSKGKAKADPEPDAEDMDEPAEGESESKEDTGGADGRALAAAIKRGDGAAIEEIVRRICEDY